MKKFCFISEGFSLKKTEPCCQRTCGVQNFRFESADAICLILLYSRKVGHCVNFKEMTYESASFNRMVADLAFSYRRGWEHPLGDACPLKDFSPHLRFWLRTKTKLAVTKERCIIIERVPGGSHRRITSCNPTLCLNLNQKYTM